MDACGSLKRDDVIMIGNIIKMHVKAHAQEAAAGESAQNSIEEKQVQDIKTMHTPAPSLVIQWVHRILGPSHTPSARKVFGMNICIASGDVHGCTETKGVQKIS